MTTWKKAMTVAATTVKTIEGMTPITLDPTLDVTSLEQGPTSTGGAEQQLSSHSVSHSRLVLRQAPATSGPVTCYFTVGTAGFEPTTP